MKLGFIGTGNMASAIMGGIIKNQIIPAEEIIGADLFAPGREKAKEQGQWVSGGEEKETKISELYSKEPLEGRAAKSLG